MKERGKRKRKKAGGHLAGGKNKRNSTKID